MDKLVNGKFGKFNKSMFVTRNSLNRKTVHLVKFTFDVLSTVIDHRIIPRFYPPYAELIATNGCYL